MPRLSRSSIGLPIACLLAFCALTPIRARGARAERSADQVLSDALAKWADVIEPSEGQPVRSFSATIKVVKAEGLPRELAGLSADVAYQAPDRLRVAASASHADCTFARDGRDL